MLLPEQKVQPNIHVAPNGSANYDQQDTSIEPPESAVSSKSSKLSPNFTTTDILQLQSAYLDNFNYLPSPRDAFLIMQGMQTLSALLTNASILQMECAPPYTLGVRVSSSPRTPVGFSPTELQSRLPHFPYIDLLPFPSMREKLLRCGEVINQDKIWSDLTAGGFTVWGKTSWDKRGWEVHMDFASKWWWLMTDKVLDESNFWRMQRGEKILTIKSSKQEFKYSPDTIAFLKTCIVR